MVVGYSLRWLVFLCFVLCSRAFALSLSLQTQVDRSELYLDETFELSVQVSPYGEISSDDMLQLEKRFDIIRRSHDIQVNYVNGQANPQITYSFVLQPKQEGIQNIPEFTINQQVSAPIQINVQSPNARTHQLQVNPIGFTAMIDSQEVYVNQKIRLVLELQMQSTIRLSQPSLTDITSNEFTRDFTVTRLRPVQFYRRQGNETHEVRQDVYELTPKKVGIFKLPAIEFQTAYSEPRKGYEDLRRTAALGSIEVKPVPKAFPQNAFWLPATSFQLHDNIDTQALDVIQNEHLEWQVTATVEGIDSKLLPDVLKQALTALPDSIKQYQNPPGFNPGVREDSVALVFTEMGEAYLPAIRIPWWNTQTHRLEYAELPERKVNVIAGVNPIAPLPNSAPLVADDAALPLVESSPSSESSFWKLTTLLLALVVVVIMVLRFLPIAVWNASIAKLSKILQSIRSLFKGGISIPTQTVSQTPTQSSSKRSNSSTSASVVRPRPTRSKPITPNEVYQFMVEHSDPPERFDQLDAKLKDIFLTLEQHLYQGGQPPSAAQLQALVEGMLALQQTKNDLKESPFDLYRLPKSQ